MDNAGRQELNADLLRLPIRSAFWPRPRSYPLAGIIHDPHSLCFSLPLYRSYILRPRCPRNLCCFHYLCFNTSHLVTCGKISLQPLSPTSFNSQIRCLDLYRLPQKSCPPISKSCLPKLPGSLSHSFFPLRNNQTTLLHQFR